MPKLSRRTLASGIGTFVSDDEPWFLIDNVKLAFSAAFPIRSKLSRARPALDFRALSVTRDLGLDSSFPLKISSVPGGQAIVWKSESTIFCQRIGGGRMPNRTLVADSNAIRAVRAAFPRAANYYHLKSRTNYIDPRYMPREEAHARCMIFFNEWVLQCCKDYCAIVKVLWKFDLDVSEVLVSVNVIELNWDARTRPGLASLGCKLFRDTWMRSVKGAFEGFEVDRLEVQADGILKGRGGTGEILKVYAKTDDLLRFEAQLTKVNAKKILEHRLDPKDAGAFSRALQKIAKSIYLPLLEIQSRALRPPAPALLELFNAALPTEPLRHVMTALLLSGVVRTRSQADYKVLRRLREKGLVSIGAGKGNWSATDKVAETLGVLRRVFESEAKWRA